MRLNFIFKTTEKIKIKFDGLVEQLGLSIKNTIICNNKVVLSVIKYLSASNPNRFTIKSSIKSFAKKQLEDIKHAVVFKSEMKTTSKKKISDVEKGKIVFISNMKETSVKKTTFEKVKMILLGSMSIIHTVQITVKSKILFKNFSLFINEIKSIGTIKSVFHILLNLSTTSLKKLNSCRDKVILKSSLGTYKKTSIGADNEVVFKCHPLVVQYRHLARLEDYDNKRLYEIDNLTLGGLDEKKI